MSAGPHVFGLTGKGRDWDAYDETGNDDQYGMSFPKRIHPALYAFSPRLEKQREQSLLFAIHLCHCRCP